MSKAPNKSPTPNKSSAPNKSSNPNKSSKSSGQPHDRDKDQEIMEKLVSVRRVTKVVKGGKNMRFSALVVVGDGKGRVGYATGKAREVPDAVRKASEQAKRTMVRIPLREGRTIHHDIAIKYGAGRVNLRTAPAGTGIIAGGPMRAVFEVLGLHDIVSKSVGTSNYHNMVAATIEALKQIMSPRQIANKLGKKVPEIIARREAHGKSEHVVEG